MTAGDYFGIAVILLFLIAWVSAAIVWSYEGKLPPFTAKTALPDMSRYPYHSDVSALANYYVETVNANNQMLDRIFKLKFEYFRISLDMKDTHRRCAELALMERITVLENRLRRLGEEP